MKQGLPIRHNNSNFYDAMLRGMAAGGFNIYDCVIDDLWIYERIFRREFNYSEMDSG